MQDQRRTIETLLERREVKKAEVLIAKVMRSDLTPDEQAQLLVLRARARLLSARPDDAIADLMTAHSISAEILAAADKIELLGDCYLARFELASVGFTDRNDSGQALTFYRQILDNYSFYENIGWIHYQMGRILLAENNVENATTSFHDGLMTASHVKALTAYCYERLAFIAFYDARDLNKAAAYIGKAIDTYPAYEDQNWLVQVHNLRSTILRAMRRYEDALRAAETALAVASLNAGENRHGLAEALLTTGELLAQFEGRERDVITHLQQFTQISKKPLGVDVTWSRVHEMLGDAYFKTGQYSAAVAAYQAALQFNPYHPWEESLHYRIARSFYQQGDYEHTVTALQRMLDAAKAEGQSISDYHIFDVLGNAQYALGRYDEALSAYRTALAMAPPNADNLDKIKTYHDFAQELSRPL